uniref:Immunoglobulin V-set domain-containing protein n=1 Tax=Otolemur garnettii TaxID=30611 RepID=H0XXR4_OTOGA
PWLLLLLLLCVSGFQDAGEEEEQVCLLEGKNLTVVCPYNIRKYASSLKAWQRVRGQGPLETLVLTGTRNADQNQAQVGRYLLEDYPTEAIIRITMTELQREDLGLYQCVIYLSSQNLIVVYHRIRLVQCKDQPVLPIVLMCGFILNKAIVLSIFFYLTRNPGLLVRRSPEVSPAQGKPSEA